MILPAHTINSLHISLKISAEVHVIEDDGRGDSVSTIFNSQPQIESLEQCSLSILTSPSTLFCSQQRTSQFEAHVLEWRIHPR